MCGPSIFAMFLRIMKRDITRGFEVVTVANLNAMSINLKVVVSLMVIESFGISLS